MIKITRAELYNMINKLTFNTNNQSKMHLVQRTEDGGTLIIASDEKGSPFYPMK